MTGTTGQCKYVIPMATEKNSKVVAFKIPPDLYREIAKLAERDDRSVSAVIRLAVRSYLKAAA